MTGNEAGQSAGEMARRAREKAERLQRSADAWDAGAAGEQETGRVLAQLDPNLWQVLHDVRWPGRARANIDHVLIGPPGVFVIDSKNWSGRVLVKDHVLRQDGRSREKAVVGVAEAGIAVLELVPDVPVHPVLCLIRDEPAEGWVRDVMLCSTANLLEMITSRPAMLAEADVRRVAAAVEAGCSRSGTGSRGAPRQRVHKSAPARSARRSSRRKAGFSLPRILAFLVMGVLMLGALQTGALAALVSTVTDPIVNAVFDEDPGTDSGQPDKGKQTRQGDKKSQKKRDGGNRAG